MRHLQQVLCPNGGILPLCDKVPVGISIAYILGIGADVALPYIEFLPIHAIVGIHPVAVTQLDKFHPPIDTPNQLSSLSPNRSSFYY